MPETTPLIKAALNLRGGAGFDVYDIQDKYLKIKSIWGITMITETDDIQRRNIELLIDGYWYEDLPPILDVEVIKGAIYQELLKIDTGAYDDFKMDEDGFITEYRNTQAPSYIFNDGIEPITFFEFKKNGTLREMQIPNIKYYCSFIYNTMAVYEDLFMKLYGEPENQQYVSNSNSYIMFNELFHVYRLYDGDEEIIDSGVFAVRNNKLTGQLALEENNVRYLSKQGSKLYSVKVDIESFYPNVYTHYLGKIKERFPFNGNFSCDKYFDFLDYYNMKINNNQTKGISAGVFSSTVSAELLMLCVDYDINAVIGEDIEYIRYVDDMTFFSDSMETIYEKLPLIQRVLNKYRLRINSNKTESKNSIYNMSYVDMYELKNRFSFFDFEVTETITLDKDIFYNLKGYIAKKYDSGEKSEIKAILTLFKKAIDRGKLVMPEDSMIHLEQYISAYMLQLACTEPVFASRCYRVIISLLNLCEGKETYDEIIKEINAKNIHINATYQDSILQVWHYYVLSKYDSNINIERVIDAFASDEVNPIIIAGFIKEGFGNNKKLFDYIKRVYMAVENREGENSYWMRSIMFSKWWLPLMLIYVKDGKNYSSFYDSNHFHDFFKSMRIEPEQEQEQLVEQVAEEDDIFW